MRISRSVTVAGSMNSFWLREVVLPRLFLGDLQLGADLLASAPARSRNCFSTLRRRSLDRHAFLLERRLELLVVLEVLLLAHGRRASD